MTLGSTNDDLSASFNRLATRPESLSEWLPFDEVLDSEKVFIQKDGSLGVIFRVGLIEHEVMTEQDIVSTVACLKSWFNLPENAVLQLIWQQLPITPRDSRFQEWEGKYQGHDVSNRLMSHRLEAIKSASSGLIAMERQAYLTIRWYPAGKKGGANARGKVLDFYRDSNLDLLREATGASKSVREFIQLIRSFEANSKISLERIGGAELTDLLRRFFNPVSYFERPFATLNPEVSLSDQAIYSPCEVSFDGIEREGIKTRTLSLKTSPSYAYSGGMAYFSSLRFPVTICINVSFPSKAQVKKFFDLKEFFLENTPSAMARRQRKEILEVQERLAKDDRCLHMSFHATVEGKDDAELDEKTLALVGIFQNELDCEAIAERDVGAALALNSLPLFYTPSTDLSARRFIRILKTDIVKFLPIFDSFRGLNNPLQLYLSREGNPVLFSLFENETSNHTVVLADSGSGKSSFVIDCVQAAKRMTPDPLVFVIDKKSSYKMLSEYFDADLTVFGHNLEMPFSPLRGVYDDDKINFVTQILASGIKLISPSYLMESDQYHALSKAVRLAHVRKVREAKLTFSDGHLSQDENQREVELTVEDIVSELASLTALEAFEKSGDMIDGLIQKLAPFYGDGLYGRYFAGSGRQKSQKINEKGSRSFFIYDLDALDSDPILQSLMMMAVVEEIRQTISQHQDEGRMGLVVLEELQMLGRGSSVGKQFVLDAAETFRKLGVWLVSLTPRPQNYFETEVGKAMWSVADNFVFLQMSSDNVDYVAKHSALLDEAGLEIVKSLRTVKGSHADVFYTNKKKTRAGAFRFFQTPLDRWLAPTNAKAMLEARRALKRHSGESWKALSELVEKYPEGL